MKFLLDANICIMLLGSPSNEVLVQRVRACAEGELATSAIVFAELMWGSANGRLPSLARIDAFAAEVAVLPFDAEAARAYASLPFRRGSFDRLIAAHAVALDMTLVTNNERDFADIPGLRLENWTLAA